MKIKAIRMFALCIVLGWMSPAFSVEEAVRVVTADGVGAVLAGDRALARDKALKDAQRNAVEIAVGVLIDSETLTRNYAVIKDEIYARSTGYIQEYAILNESTEYNLLRVSIEAHVKLAPLKEDLGRVIRKVGRPRVLFMIAETEVGRNQPTAWWEGAAGMGGQVVDAALQDYFLSRRFLIVDHSLKRPSRKVSANPTDGEAVTLAREYDAEVVVVGRAVAKDSGKIQGYDLHSCRAEISARAIQVDNSHVLASANAGAAAAHIDPMSGGIEALKKASANLSKTLVDRIIDQWAGRAEGTATVTLDIVEVTGYSDFVRFKSLLKDEVRGVSTVYQRTFASGSAVLEVEYSGTAQDLADELALKDFESFRVDILEASHNRLKIKFIPRKL